MSLIQLVAQGLQNSRYNIPRNLAIEYFTEDFVNDSFVVPRGCDTKLPEYLEIELNSNIDRNNFKNICHKVCFEMEIGGQKILSIPLRFMMQLKNCEICDNKIYITIPFEMFCSEIRLICLQYHEVRFKLTNIENNFTSCKLISKGIYYDTDIRRNMAQNEHKEIIQQLASTEINCSNPRNEFKYRIPFDSIHKGFYIECENVDEINEIRLTLNDSDRFIYNRFLVRTKCIKISQHLLYLPLNFDKSYQDRSRTGFEGSINLSRIDSSVLYIKLDNLQSKICIYGLGSNMLRYMSGMGGLSSGSSCSHDYEEYNEGGNYTRHQENNYVNLITDVSSNNIVNIIYKPITNNEKLSCCITHEEISVNSRYMSCSHCSNNFDENSIKSWFRQRPHNKTCPMCRANWSDFNVYINSEESEAEQIEESNTPEILDPPIPI